MLRDALRLLIIVLIVWTLYKRFGGKIVGAKARELVGAGALLLDVRTPSEFAGGHLQGALNIPVSELGARVGELGQDRARPIVVYCASGMRSASAKTTLRGLGFVDVHDLGAMGRW